MAHLRESRLEAKAPESGANALGDAIGARLQHIYNLADFS